MSHSVRIDYESISIECRSICEVAAGQLCKINAMLDKISMSSSKLLNGETEDMKAGLLKQEAALREKIQNLVKASDRQDARGIAYADNAGKDPYAVIRAAGALKSEVNKFLSAGMYAYESLLDNLLRKKIAEHAGDMRLRSQGTAAYNAEFSAQLKTVQDEALKGFIYLEWLDNGNSGKAFDELKKLAEQKMKSSIAAHIASNKPAILREIETDMRDAKLDEGTIQEVLSSGGTGADDQSQIEKIREKASEEITGERIRRETLKVIIACIEKRGFIVDRKNIKHQKEKDEVVFIAQKPGGEWAEFRVMLNGKFVYRFDGYEGQACQKDIQPFMQDLEDVYGVKVRKAEEIWRNPDKLTTEKYQAQKHNVNRG